MVSEEIKRIAASIVTVLEESNKEREIDRLLKTKQYDLLKDLPQNFF